jgi:acyl-CoA reductase-like NAD-dependent aldehyde dehydrogenase
MTQTMTHAENGTGPATAHATGHHEGPGGATALHWIGGRWMDSGEHGESINPATGEVIGAYVTGGRREAELAVHAALRAFRETDWKDNRPLRARVLNRMAERFEARAEDLAQLLAFENGKISRTRGLKRPRSPSTCISTPPWR